MDFSNDKENIQTEHHFKGPMYKKIPCVICCPQLFTKHHLLHLLSKLCASLPCWYQPAKRLQEFPSEEIIEVTDEDFVD